jgi:ankyrin repeat protein
VLTLLLEKGADVNLASNDGVTPVNIASQNGHAEVLALLLEKGADVNQADDDGGTPVHIASQEGHADVLILLLEKGADVNRARNNGSTPLTMASENGHFDIVRVLLNSGADRSARSIGKVVSCHYVRKPCVCIFVCATFNSVRFLPYCLLPSLSYSRVSADFSNRPLLYRYFLLC